VTDVALRIVIGSVVLLLALIIRAASVNRLVRRKLRLSFFLALAYILVAVFLGRFALSPDMAARVLSVIQLSMALAIINLFVVVAINPLRADRVPERFPIIVQDTIIIGLFVVVATVVIVGLMVLLRPAPAPSLAGVEVPTVAEVQAISASHCASCHAARPTFDGIAVAPKGVMLETPAQLRRWAQATRQQVQTEAMPPGNMTDMTAEERAKILAWIAAGAPLQ
jgi:uncharacterized membrane protein